MNEVSDGIQWVVWGPLVFVTFCNLFSFTPGFEKGPCLHCWLPARGSMPLWRCQILFPAVFSTDMGKQGVSGRGLAREHELSCLFTLHLFKVGCRAW